MSVTKRLRYEILRRDNHACRYCGAAAPEARLTVDHVIPVALGGTDEPSNLVAACVDCNSGKSGTPADASLVADVEQDALRWARAMRSAIEIDRQRRDAREDELRRFHDAWDDWTWTDGKGARHRVALPDDWHLSVGRLLDAGLVVDDLATMVHDVMTTRGVRDEFRYFCGVAWNTVKGRQEIARSLLDAEEG